MTAALHYFRWAFLVTFVGIVGCAVLGWFQTGTFIGALSFLSIGIILATLEISLSFDNAVVNANRLKTMSPEWQHRFLTWGILVAVFGMRLVFPLLIVVIAAGIGPWQALVLATVRPQEYAEIIHDAHLGIAAFGGAFLMMVALNFFIDEGKEVDWIAGIERWLRRFASVRGMEIALVLSVVLLFAMLVPSDEVATLMVAACLGLLTFLLTDVIGRVLDRPGAARRTAVQGGAGAFLSLEVLDASFSFDGVIGAFALTHNLYLIAIGLGIGAMYVRSMTIMLVERRTLTQFRYLECGAFWAVLVLAIIMFVQTMVPVSEIVTGTIGTAFIGWALLSSVRSRPA